MQRVLAPTPLPLPAGPLPTAAWMLRELYRLRVGADPGREALRFSDQVISHGELLARVDHWQERLEAAVARIGGLS